MIAFRPVRSPAAQLRATCVRAAIGKPATEVENLRFNQITTNLSDDRSSTPMEQTEPQNADRQQPDWTESRESRGRSSSCCARVRVRVQPNSRQLSETNATSRCAVCCVLRAVCCRLPKRRPMSARSKRWRSSVVTRQQQQTSHSVQR